MLYETIRPHSMKHTFPDPLCRDSEPNEDWENKGVLRELEQKKPQLDELLHTAESLKGTENRQQLHGKGILPVADFVPGGLYDEKRSSSAAVRAMTVSCCIKDSILLN
ncbi:unnamed protein product [Plutella xylostella]|uniref:(diamondback moth) hypothetical protein n=1 Tax=Plutella xylostella TaxID=51655 RepID=A0A8S4G713_PLUXY|nr:unnamed protein product [Plutella xylostella]